MQRIPLVDDDSEWPEPKIYNSAIQVFSLLIVSSLFSIISINIFFGNDFSQITFVSLNLASIAFLCASFCTLFVILLMFASIEITPDITYETINQRYNGMMRLAVLLFIFAMCCFVITICSSINNIFLSIAVGIIFSIVLTFVGYKSISTIYN